MTSTSIEPFDIVIHHHPCYDGFTAAWAARLHSPNAQFVGAQHGDTPPDVQGKRVLIVDFSYKRPVLEAMIREASFVMILDHHKTAAEDLEGLGSDMPDRVSVIFDLERSGAGITWDTLVEGFRPSLVDFVEDRDLWRFQYPETRAFQAGLSSLAMSFEDFTWAAENPGEILKAGKPVLQVSRRIAESIAERAARKTIGKIPMLAVNVTPEYVSEVAEILYTRHPDLPVLGWHWDGTKGNYYCSLRSHADGPDVSKIAQQFGGGGHLHAAGFRLSSCPV